MQFRNCVHGNLERTCLVCIREYAQYARCADSSLLTFDEWLDRRNRRAAGETEDVLFENVKKEIHGFEPAAHDFGNEICYQLNLYGWLKKTFPQARFEEQRGSSRPDIVIDDIAIEIKGPTTTMGLDSILSKFMRYKKHFDKHLIVVLFERKVTDSYLKEWKDAIIELCPEIVIIEKRPSVSVQNRN